MIITSFTSFFDNALLPFKKYKGRGLFKKTETEAETLREEQKTRAKQRKNRRINKLKKRLESLEDKKDKQKKIVIQTSQTQNQETSFGQLRMEEEPARKKTA